MKERNVRRMACVLGAVVLAGAAHAELFVGLEGSSPVTKSSDLTGFPDVTWVNHFAFDVSGAAAAPDGTLYLCNGAFTTRLYRSTDFGTPQLVATLSKDIHGMGFGRGKLYGYSNYATPKGIYEIDTTTGDCTLVLDVYTDTGFRFFAFDYNPVDDLFYGYTEYGNSGLYSINIDTGEMIKLAGTIPATNGQGRGLAVGNNTVYLTATRGDDNIDYYAYDLSQGVGGTWTPFTQPYPAYHSTGGAAWIPGPCPGDLDGDRRVELSDLAILLANYGTTSGADPEDGDMDGDGDVDLADLSAFLSVYGTVCN